MDFSSFLTYFGLYYYFFSVIIAWITSIIIFDETKSYTNVMENSTRKIRNFLYILHPILTVMVYYLPQALVTL